jgi:hypothetical protein
MRAHRGLLPIHSSEVNTNMNTTPEVCPNSPWVRLRSASRAQLRTLHCYTDQRLLEGNLASLVDAAQSHRSNGTPAGAPVYAVLDREAKLLCDSFCDRWNIDPEKLYAELPGLSVLRDAAVTKPTPYRPITVLLVVAAVLMTGFMVGVTGACIRVGFHLLGGGR